MIRDLANIQRELKFLKRRINHLSTLVGSGGSENNFATADLTLTGNRTHDLNSNVLRIEQSSTGVSFLEISPTGIGGQEIILKSEDVDNQNQAYLYTATLPNVSTLELLTEYDGGTAFGQVLLSSSSVVGSAFEVSVNRSAFDGTFIILNIQEFADNAAAITGGLIIGTLYRTGDVLKIVH